MPLQKSHKDKKHLKNRHNKASLSPKHQMTGTLQEASYDTYPDINKTIRTAGFITLEMVEGLYSILNVTVYSIILKQVFLLIIKLTIF